MSLGTPPTGTQPTTERPHRQRRSGARALVVLLVLAVVAAIFAGYQVGVGQEQRRASTGAAPTATSGAGVLAATATTAKPTPPPARLVGILITKNVGPGEKQGQANRVYLRGVDIKPGPGLRIVPAPLQPIDVDPRDDVYRIVQVPVRKILDNPSQSWHSAPQLVVHLGERVKVIVQNRDPIEHSFTFERARKTVDIFSGQTKTVEFTVPSKRPPKDQPFQYYCRWRALGMDGPFVVRA